MMSHCLLFLLTFPKVNNSPFYGFRSLVLASLRKSSWSFSFPVMSSMMSSLHIIEGICRDLSNYGTFTLRGFGLILNR